MSRADDADTLAADDLCHTRQGPEQGLSVPSDHPGYVGGEQEVAEQHQIAKTQAAMIGAVAWGMDQIQGEPLHQQALNDQPRLPPGCRMLQPQPIGEVQRSGLNILTCGQKGQVHPQGLKAQFQEGRLGLRQIGSSQGLGPSRLHGDDRQSAIVQFRLGAKADEVIEMGVGQEHQEGSGPFPPQFADLIRHQSRLLGLTPDIDQEQDMGGFNEKGVGAEAGETGDPGVDACLTPAGQDAPLIGDHVKGIDHKAIELNQLRISCPARACSSKREKWVLASWTFTIRVIPLLTGWLSRRTKPSRPGCREQVASEIRGANGWLALRWLKGG